MKKEEILKAIIYSLSFLFAVSIWTYTELQKSDNGRFRIEQGMGNIPYLIDSRTGEVWRYYRNTDSSGKPTDEGFMRIKYGE